MLVDVQTVTVVIAGISVIIGVINSILANRRAEKQRELTQQTQQQALETRQAELFMQIYERMNTTEWRTSLFKILYEQEWTDFDDWRQKYPFSFDSWLAGSQVGNYFIGLGVLLEQGLLDPNMVEDLIGDIIIDYWEKMQPLILTWRKSNPKSGEHIEYLYNAIINNRQQEVTIST